MYITLDISLKFVGLEKMKITSLEPKDYLGTSVIGLIASMGLKTIGRPKKNKKERYAITNVSMKDLSNINKEFEILLYECYVWKRTKHEPTASYFYLARHIDKCMMRADGFNPQVDPVRMKISCTR